MARKLTEMRTADGVPIYIQYDEEDSDELRAVGVFDADPTQRLQHFTDSMQQTVRSYAETVLTAVRTGVEGLPAPEKVTVEFGLQVGGEAGVPFVTKGTTQANVKVSLSWDFSQKK